VDFQCVLDAIMETVSPQMNAIVFMDGMEITVQHVNVYQDVSMEDVVINPILVTVKMDGKAYFVMSPFASPLVIMELVYILMTQ